MPIVYDLQSFHYQSTKNGMTILYTINLCYINCFLAKNQVSLVSFPLIDNINPKKLIKMVYV